MQDETCDKGLGKMTLRKCPTCGKMHDLILKNTVTNERVEEFDKCYDCLMSGCSFKPVIEHIYLTEEDYEKEKR